MQSVAFVAVFVGLEWLSFLHEHDGLPVTPWNPGLGLILGLIIHWGPLQGLVLFAGVLSAEILVLGTDLPLPLILAVSAIVAVVYTLVAAGLRPVLDRDGGLFQARDILILATGALAGAVVTSTLLCGLLLSFRYFDLGDIARTAAPLVLGDLIGIVVVTPLVLRVMARVEHPDPVSFAGIAELMGLALAIAVILVVTTWPGQSHQSLFYLLFLPVVIAAVRQGIDGACVGLVITQLVLVALLHFQGFDLTRFTEHQLLMLVLTLTGLVVGALVSGKQIADRQAHEAAERLQQIQAEAARVERFNLVSGMAGALAHEINQPMTAARALARSVQLLLQQPNGDLKRAETNVAGMIEQIDHAGAVIQRMREFLRKGEPHVSTLDLAEVIADAAALARPLARSRQIGLDVVVAGQTAPVFGDQVQIQQVVINLVSNGIEAIGRTGRGDGQISIEVAGAGGDGVEVRVRDNGGGIDPAMRETLFDPLSTSRADGIGLGLSICKTIVQSHHGRIWLEASSHEGSELRFRLPRAVNAKSSSE